MTRSIECIPLTVESAKSYISDPRDAEKYPCKAQADKMQLEISTTNIPFHELTPLGQAAHNVQVATNEGTLPGIVRSLGMFTQLCLADKQEPFTGCRPCPFRASSE